MSIERAPPHGARELNTFATAVPQAARRLRVPFRTYVCDGDLVPFPSDLLELREQLVTANARLETYRFRNLDEPEQLLVHLLKLARDFSQGCLTLADANLPAPLWLVYRTLLETLFRACWATTSRDHVNSYLAASGVAQLARAARRSLERGSANVVDRSTGEDATKNARDDLRDLERSLPTIEQMADQAGLGVVYDLIYRAASIVAHAASFGLSLGSTADDTGAIVPAVTVTLRATMLAVDNRLSSNRATSSHEICVILHVKPSKI